jgi:hypothetical protein
VTRRLAVAVVALLVGVVVATVGGEDAGAQSPPPYLDLRNGITASSDANKKAWANIIRSAQTSGSGTYGTSLQTTIDGLPAGDRRVLFKRLLNARVAARLMPALRLAGPIGLAITAGYVGWRVHQHFWGGGDMWLDSAGMGADVLYNPDAVPFGNNKANLHWHYSGSGSLPWDDAWVASPTGGSTDQMAAGSAGMVGAAWVYSTLNITGNGGCQWMGETECYLLMLNPWADGVSSSNYAMGRFDTSRSCTTAGISMGTNCWWDWDSLNAIPGLADSVLPPASVGGLDTGLKFRQQLSYAVTRTYKSIAERFGDDVVYATVHTGASGQKIERIGMTVENFERLIGTTNEATLTAPDVVTNYDVPSTYSTDPDDPGANADVQNGLDEFSDTCGQIMINHLLAPGSHDWMPGCFENPPAPTEGPDDDVSPLLRPRSGETVPQYRARLREQGHLGAIVVNTAAENWAQFDPDVPVQLKVHPAPGSSRSVTTTRLDVAWPAPLAGTGDTIVITKNPPGAPPATGEPPLGPIPPGGEGADCPCPIDSIDLRSVAPEGLCGKAPFGAFCWIEDQVSALFGGPAEPPSFSFNPGAIETELVTLPASTFDLELDLADTPAPILDAFGLIRVVLGFAVWLIGCWMLGRKILGATAPDGLGADPEWDAGAGSYGGQYR